jgi:hypothetical protein
LTIAPDGAMPVCAAMEVGAVRWLPGLNDAALARLGPLTLTSTAARVDGGIIHGDRVEARDASGRLLLCATGLVARPMGDVEGRVLTIAQDPPRAAVRFQEVHGT